MIEWAIKKIICGKINDLLKQYQNNVSKVKETLKRWIERIKKVLACFESLLSKIDDDELTTDEVKEAAEEVNSLVKGW